MKVIELKKGDVYFLVGFYDSELSIPSITTCIYEGLDVSEEHGHLFKSVVGSAEKSGNNQSYYISFSEGEINGILDKKALMEWLNEEHSPRSAGQEYEYKAL